MFQGSKKSCQYFFVAKFVNPNFFLRDYITIIVFFPVRTVEPEHKFIFDEECKFKRKVTCLLSLNMVLFYFMSRKRLNVD